jgi:hypothetical protein
MATTILEMLGTVRSDGTLDLDHKVTVAPGRVKIRVESVESPVPAADGLVQFVQTLRQEMAAAGHQFRTKEEIDTEIEELRREWDE